MSEQNDSQNNRSIELCKRVVTTESFIAEAKDIYGDRYDYSKVDYKNRENRVTVVCPIHGDFQVFAREHLDGKGCPKCEKGDKFIKKVKDKFGDKFGLEKFVYQSSISPVTLICPSHGAFSKLPQAILSTRCGCPECGKELSELEKESARLEALDHKEERGEERKERQRLRNEEKRLAALKAEQKAADECKQNRKKRVEAILYGKYDSECYWYEDVFGYNLQNCIADNGTVIDGKWRIFPKGNHYPIYEFGYSAENGNVIKATFYTLDISREEQIELLTLFLYYTKGQSFVPSEANDLYVQLTEQDVKVEGIADGYKLSIDKRGFSDGLRIKIRKLGVQQQLRTFASILQKPISPIPHSYVGIDFETLYPQRVSACSVGLAKYKDGVLVDKYYSLIRPPFDYPGKKGRVLTWIHGFTEDDVSDVRTFKEILPEIESFVEGLPLVVHNACVERACIRDACTYYDIETSLDYEHIIDTLYLSQQVEAKIGISDFGPETHSLDAVCRRFGVEAKNHHNSLYDAEMCGNLLVEFKKILSENSQEMNQVILKESPTPSHKYNAEDKVQRTDLENVADNPFKDKVVVLTGFAKADSQQYAHQLNQLGAIIKEGVNKKTNFLITGYNAGPSKVKKAEEFGARIIAEEEFKEIISQLQ